MIARTCHANVVAVQEDLGEFGCCAGVVAVLLVSLKSHACDKASGVLFRDIFKHHV